MSTPRSVLGLLGALLAASLALTACGSSEEPTVASLPGDSVQHATGDASGEDPGGATGDDGSGDATGRPLLRVDDTRERVSMLWNAYNTCLLQHGARKPGPNEIVAAPGGGDDGPGVLVHQPVPRKAEAACRQQLPEGPLELEAATNPHFHEQSLDYVACLRRHGEFVQLLNDHDLSWTYEPDHSVPDDNAQFEQACLVEAFGGSQ